MSEEELYFTFPCGCKFKQKGEQVKDYDGLPPIELDFYNIPLTCEATWDLISSGRTRGVFQLESNLGRGYAKKLEPSNIDHLAALTALLRPGCLGCNFEGKSMTNHFVDRKQGIDEVTYYEERLEPYLKTTFGVMTYQEQMIALSKGLAGYSPQQANKLRKAVGKKDVTALYALKESFIDGCVSNGISNENANHIFDDIKSSGRYLFNACLDPLTLVQLENGELKTLDELEIGSKILSPNVDDCGDYVEVVNKYDNGEKEVYEVTLESGDVICCTLEHKFLCEDGEIRPLIEILELNIGIVCQDD